MPLTKVASSMLASGAAGSGGSTGKNYISSYNNNTCNGDFESGSISGWSVCSVTGITNGVPTSAPTIISSPTASDPALTLLSSGQLAGQYSLQAVFPTTSIREGFISDVFTIDSEDQAKVLTFKFYYNVTSGAANGNFSGTSSNTFIVAVYAVNGANVGWIQPAGVYAMTQSSGGAGIATGTFQTYSDTTQYRFAILCAVAPTPASITVSFDDFQVGPLTAPIGAPVTDWQNYTPTLTNITISNGTVNGRWRRVGDSIEVDIGLTAGSTTSFAASAFQFSLPSGLNFDLNKIAQIYGEGPIGLGSVVDVGSQNYGPFNVSIASPNSVQLRAANAASTYVQSSTSVIQGLPVTLGTGDYINVHFSAPIAGWSANVQMSNDTDTRVAAFKYRLNSSYSYTSGNPGYFDLRDYDTHGTFTVGGTVAAGSSYTIPVSGIWSFTFSSDLSGTTGYSINIRKNGNPVGETGWIQDAGGFTWNLSCNAGEVITVVMGSTTTTGPSYMAFSGYRLSGPSVVAATESVNASYYVSMNFNASASIPINFDTKEYDSHNAVTTSNTAWKFTAPISGIYSISAYLYGGGFTVIYTIYKNGTTAYKTMLYQAAGVITSGTATVKLNAGEYIDIRPDTSRTITGAALNNSYASYIQINRIGN